MLGDADPGLEWKSVTPVLRVAGQPEDSSGSWYELVQSMAGLDQSRYALLTSSGARTPVQGLRFADGSRASIRTVGKYQWIVPFSSLFDGELGLEAEVPRQVAPFLELLAILDPSELALDSSALHELVVCKELGRFVLDLDHQLGRAKSLGTRSAACRQFVAFDFSCWQAVHDILVPGTTVDELLQMAEACNQVPGFASRAAPCLKKVLGILERRGPQDAPLSRMRRSLGEELTEYRDRGLKLLDSMSSQREADILLLAPFLMETMEVLGPGVIKKDQLGLVRPDDLLMFAQGELAIDSPNETMNSEPNGALFFAFAEMFLECALQLEQSEPRWVDWARTAIAAEVLFVESYVPVGKAMDLQLDYYERGPLDWNAKKQAARRQAVTKHALGLDADKLWAEHIRVLQAACHADHARRIGWK